MERPLFWCTRNVPESKLSTGTHQLKLCWKAQFSSFFIHDLQTIVKYNPRHAVFGQLFLQELLIWLLSEIALYSLSFLNFLIMKANIFNFFWIIMIYRYSIVIPKIYSVNIHYKLQKFFYKYRKKSFNKSYFYFVNG